MRKSLFLIFLVALVALTSAVASAVDVVLISEDPYTNASSQHQTQVEPDTFAWGNTIVSAFQSGRFYDGGASNICWATSTDGGVTWTDGCLPSLTTYSTPPGPYQRASDPVVGYDAEHGVWMINSLGIENAIGVAVVVSRSTDGLNWSAPVVVSNAGIFGFYDKNWMTCDNWVTSPFYGNCYVEWDDAFALNKFYMSTSTDGGVTWGPKKGPSNLLGGLGGQPLAMPNGGVIVPAANLFGTQMLWFGSRDGGQSWSRTRTISNINSHTVAGNLRASTFLGSAEIDASGKIYLVWPDCRFRSGCSSNDLVMSTTTNGSTWTSPVRIPIDPTNSTVDHFIPGLAVDRTTSGSSARLGLTYYYYPNASCTTSTCQLYVGFTSSMDGGVSWSVAETVAGPMQLSWIADTSQGRMVGDYISTSFVGDNAIPVFANAFAPSGGLFQEHSYTALLPVTADQEYPLVVADDPVYYDYPDPILLTPITRP
ncbi:MAG: sialidase family protein [Chloroflexota bacterium]